MTMQGGGLRSTRLRCDCTLVAGCRLQDAEQEASHPAGAGSMGLMATLKAEPLSTSAAWLTIQVTVNLQSSIWDNLRTHADGLRETMGHRLRLYLFSYQAVP